MIISKVDTGAPVVVTTTDGGAGGGPDFPIPEPRAATTIEWIAPWLERTWNLTDLTSPVVKLEGMKGLGGTEPVHWFSEAPTLDGASWGGMRTPRGELFCPVLVHAETLDAFLAEHRAFRRSLDPRQEGYFRVTQPNGRYRQIACRYDSGGELTADYDPIAQRLATFGVTWSTDPYWQGPPIERTYEFEVGTAFFPGPPFTLGKGLNITGATVDNPGDVAAYPTWRVTAPFTGFQVGVGAALVTATITKATGYIDIDMNPTKLTVVDEAGVDRWSALTAAEFTSISAGTGLALALSVTGAAAGSSVRLSFVPRYWSAW